VRRTAASLIFLAFRFATEPQLAVITVIKRLKEILHFVTLTTDRT
jgi:hypothetical protein